MKNITISLDDATYRRVRILAAERETSVSGLVKHLLTELDSGGSLGGQLRERERELRKQVANFRASDHRLSRDEIHGRGA